METDYLINSNAYRVHSNSDEPEVFSKKKILRYFGIGLCILGKYGLCMAVILAYIILKIPTTIYYSISYSISISIRFHDNLIPNYPEQNFSKRSIFTWVSNQCHIPCARKVLSLSHSQSFPLSNFPPLSPN